MIENVEIVKYQDSDFENLARLFREDYAEIYPFLDAKFLELNRFRDILREHTLPDSEVWLAKANGDLVGFTAIQKNFIDQLYVRKDYQNKGLGGYWIQQAKLMYPDFLELYTLASNENAIEFYKKHGFTVIERGIAPDEQVADVKMRWQNKNNE